MNMKVSDAKREEGFTLIELLVVVIIIGLLAAIAIPIFLNQRERAWIRTAESDARNMAIEIETYFNDNFVYPEADFFLDGRTDGDVGEIPGTDDDSIVVSPNVTLRYIEGGSSYVIEACHELVHDDTTEECSDDDDNTTARYDSATGGIVTSGYPTE